MSAVVKGSIQKNDHSGVCFILLALWFHGYSEGSALTSHCLTRLWSEASHLHPLYCFLTGNPSPRPVYSSNIFPSSNFPFHSYHFGFYPEPRHPPPIQRSEMALGEGIPSGRTRAMVMVVETKLKTLPELTGDLVQVPSLPPQLAVQTPMRACSTLVRD